MRSVIIRGEHGIRVFGSNVLRGISGPMKQTGGENYVMGTSQSELLPLYKYMVNKMEEGEMDRAM